MPPQVFRFDVGRFSCAVIHDGDQRLDADFLFGGAPPETLADVLQANGLEREAIPSSWNCFYVDTGYRKVLVDTGMGTPQAGLLPGLAALGVAPEEIDVVILSHGHADHIGGNTDAAGSLHYPNARFVMSLADWAFFTAEEHLATLSSEFAASARKNLPPLHGHLDLIYNEGPLLPGIHLVSTPGHTPGHLCVRVSSGDDTLYVFGDAVLHPLYLTYPDWYAGVDNDPVQAVATRRALLERVAQDEALALAYHFDFPALGYVRPDGAVWRWDPLADGG